MTKPLLTYERACEVLVYDPETGSLNWRIARPGAPKGALVGTRTADGYTQVEVDYRLYRVHRVAWLLMTGEWPHHFIDHINGMRADNRWKNLREATPLQNARNRRAEKETGSGRIGVIYCKSSARWRAHIGVEKRTIHLGFYTDKADAIAAREAAEKEHYGEFAPRKAVA